MSVNKYQPHVFVLPEDDANRQVATGFTLDPSLMTRKIQVLAVAGGWTQVVESFKTEELTGLNCYPNRFMILLIDFDAHGERLNVVKAEVPSHLTERVFVLGAWKAPEALKAANLGDYETIGLAMARDCREGTEDIWGHELLRDNAAELDRLRQRVRPFLFIQSHS